MSALGGMKGRLRACAGSTEHGVVAAYSNLNAAVEHVVELARTGGLAFTLYEIGPGEDQINVATDRLSRAEAVRFFAQADLRWPDGTEMRTNIRVRAGASWVSVPVRDTGEPPDPAALDGLIGLDINEAALRANAGHWLVRAYEREAVLTADRRMNRANLLYAESGAVLNVQIG